MCYETKTIEDILLYVTDFALSANKWFSTLSISVEGQAQPEGGVKEGISLELLCSPQAV